MPTVSGDARGCTGRGYFGDQSRLLAVRKSKGGGG